VTSQTSFSDALPQPSIERELTQQHQDESAFTDPTWIEYWRRVFQEVAEGKNGHF